MVEIDEKSNTLDKIIEMNRKFIENHDPRELEKKINFMKSKKAKDNSEEIEMSIWNQQYQAGPLLSGKHELRKKMLQEDKQELDELEKIINQINEMTKETSNMIL